MALLKKIYMPYYDAVPSPGALYARIFRVVDGFWLDNTDGVFKVSPTDPKNHFISQPSPSIYYYEDNRTAWDNGQYHIFAYEDATNYLFAGGELYILNDVEVSQATLLQYMEFIKKIEEGNWELVGNQWIYYDTDGTTHLVTFNTKDSAGSPSMTNIFKREKV
jgi:hypothetical protein